MRTDIKRFLPPLQTFDGDGRTVKTVTTMQRVGSPAASAETKYKIHSTALGAELTQIKADGTKEKTNIYAGGAIIAEQIRTETNQEKVEWHHADPVTGSRQTVSKTGETAIRLKARQEYEPLGQAVRTSALLIL